MSSYANGAADAPRLHVAGEREAPRPSTRRGWLVRRMLVAADVAGLAAAFLFVELVLGTGGAATPGGDRLTGGWEYVAALVTLPAWILAARLYGLYQNDEVRTDHSTTDELVSVFHLVTVLLWTLTAVAWTTGLVHPQFPKLLLFWVLAIVLITTARVVARAYCRRHASYVQKTLIVGAGDVGQQLARKILQHPEYGIELVGFLDASPKERREDLGDLALVGSLHQLPELVREYDVERVVFAFSNESDERILGVIRSLAELEVQVDVVPRVFELVSPGVSVHSIEGLPVLGLPPFRLPRSSRMLKRALDLVISLVALTLLAPVFLVIAVAIKLASRGPVFFRQERMGARDRMFRIFKFRTMVADAEERKPELSERNMHAVAGGDPRMFKMPDDPRITAVGAFLRRYSLDELPQLLNVVKGDMAIVGPRPLILDEDRHVVDWARRRLYVKPGITGLWQVLGRSDIPFAEMTRLDYVYVGNWSVWGDLQLMLRTIPVVFQRRAAY